MSKNWKVVTCYHCGKKLRGNFPTLSYFLDHDSGMVIGVYLHNICAIKRYKDVK